TTPIASKVNATPLQPRSAKPVPSTAVPAIPVSADGDADSASRPAQSRHTRSESKSPRPNHIAAAITSSRPESASRSSNQNPTDKIPVAITTAPEAGRTEVLSLDIAAFTSKRIWDGSPQVFKASSGSPSKPTRPNPPDIVADQTRPPGRRVSIRL